MKKMLLSLAVTLLAATSITAQISSVMNAPADVQLQNPYPTSLVPRGFRAPANRVELADNQLIMGGYTTDQIATPGNGLGVGSYTTGRVGAYLELPCSAIADFDGSQVVKMRVGLAAAATIYQITIMPVKNGSIQTAILDQAVRSTSQGWNEFTLDTPLTLDLADYDALLMGFTYNQASNVYPLSCVNAGSESYNTLIYANLGDGIGYYNIGNSYGNLSVQAIVEGDFPQYKAIPQSIGDVIIPLGGSVTKSLDIYNKGKANLESIDYVITIDGEAQPEQHVELATPVIYGEKGEAEIIFDAAATECFQDYTLTVTKVNGEENAATNPVVSGRAITTTKIFQRRVTVEEFTGLTCGYCPRGIVGMEMMRQRYGDQLVQIAIHQYSSLSQDAMTIAASNYARLTFSGAPGCMLDRMGEVDPYYGSTNGDDFGISQLIDVLLAQPAFVNVDVNGEWNEDSTKVVATALVDPLIDGSEYDLEFVLIGDSLTGTGSGWTQTNYYASYTAAQVGEDMADFCRGGKYGKSSVTGLYFNDVALASSYKSNKNQIERQVYSAAEPTEVNYTLTLPTTTAMKKAMRRDNMYIAALIIDPATGYIMNAAKTKLPVYVPEPQPEVLDLTIDHERQTGMGYTADEVAVDFTEAISFLGVESLTTDMLFFENPDGSLIDYNAYATANYDGWCNEEGAAENWGSTTKICVKFFQAISATDGKFQICDMNGADEDGKTYTVKWQLVNGLKTARYTINVTFKKPEVKELEIVDKGIATSVSYDVTEGDYVMKTATITDEQVAAICQELGIEALTDATIFGFNPTTKELVKNHTGYDGWRDANGDFHNWNADGTQAPACVKINDNGTTDGGQTYYCYNRSGQEPQTIKCYWALANEEKAVLVEIDFVYFAVIPDAAELTAPEGWTSVITNGNLAGDDVKSYIAKEYPSTEPTGATIVPGAGKDGSRGIVVKSQDKVNEAWDSQFWIQFGEKLPDGTKLHVEFDYKADLAGSVSTQAHGLPGKYQHYAAIGNVDFATEWKHFSTDIVVSGDMATGNGGDGMLSIAFNLNDIANANNYYFDNFGVWMQKPAPVDDWTNILRNSDLEGTQVDNFFSKEAPSTAVVPSTIYEGAGIDGSRGIKVVSAPAAANDWDTQFWIYLPTTLPEGTKYKVEFDYKADRNASADTQAHGEPGNYIFYTMIGSPSFTTEWQHYEREGTISADQAEGKTDGVPNGNKMRSIAFNLSKDRDNEVTYFFDNIKFFVEKAFAETGIVNVNSNNVVEGAIYNLRGQQVKNAQKGIFIQNGRKMVIK